MREVTEAGRPAPEALAEIVDRIVRTAHPRRIVLFGSAAKGTMGPHSDVDLLIVTEGPVHRRQLAGDIYMKLGDVRYSVDIIVVTPEDVERYGTSHSLVIAPALREGKVVYDSNAL